MFIDTGGPIEYRKGGPVGSFLCSSHRRSCSDVMHIIAITRGP